MVRGLMPVFIKFFPVFEPLTPTFLSFFIKRKLGEWKNQGLITDYEARSRRLGKYHYKVAVDLELTKEQAKNARNIVVKKFLKTE